VSLLQIIFLGHKGSTLDGKKLLHRQNLLHGNPGVSVAYIFLPQRHKGHREIIFYFIFSKFVATTIHSLPNKGNIAVSLVAGQRPAIIIFSLCLRVSVANYFSWPQRLNTQRTIQLLLDPAMLRVA
jgi:hypothetical protein